MTRKKKTFSKSDICSVSDDELMSEIEVTGIENSNMSLVTFRDKSFVVKSGNRLDIIRSIKSQCSCACGSEIKL